MTFVVKEFLSAASWVTPRALIRLDRFLSDSFPFEFSSSFPGNGLERIAGGPGYRKLRRNARSGSTPAIFGRLSRQTTAAYGARLRLVRKFRGPRARCEASPITSASRDDDRALACRCRGRYLQLQVGSRLNPDVTVDPPLSRSNPCNNHNTTGCPPWCNSRLIRSSPNSKTP